MTMKLSRSLARDLAIEAKSRSLRRSSCSAPTRDNQGGRGAGNKHYFCILVLGRGAPGTGLIGDGTSHLWVLQQLYFVIELVLGITL